jgi:hypothetical protein
LLLTRSETELLFILLFGIGGDHISNILLITGGFGNQLFQICAALSLTKEKTLLIDSSLSSVYDEKERIAAEKIQLPSNIRFIRGRGPLFLSRKVFNFFVRLSVSERVAFNNELIVRPLLVFGSMYFSWRFNQKLSIVLPKRIGKIDERSRNSGLLFIGYFQNSLYLNRLRIREPFLLNAIENSLEVLELKKQSSGKTILVVHVRLGDYLQEDKFGIPQNSYYTDALKLAHDKLSFDEIWIFSNDLVGAKKLLPVEYQNQARYFQNVGLDDIHLMQGMSIGSHFILGNSTFGWWAAQFSENQNKLVIVPKPWFKGISEPEGLIPTSWARLDAGF